MEVHFIYEHLYKVIQLLNSRIILDGKYCKDSCKAHIMCLPRPYAFFVVIIVAIVHSLLMQNVFCWFCC